MIFLKYFFNFLLRLFIVFFCVYLFNIISFSFFPIVFQKRKKICVYLIFIVLISFFVGTLITDSREITDSRDQTKNIGFLLHTFVDKCFNKVDKLGNFIMPMPKSFRLKLIKFNHTNIIIKILNQKEFFLVYPIELSKNGIYKWFLIQSSIKENIESILETINFFETINFDLDELESSISKEYDELSDRTNSSGYIMQSVTIHTPKDFLTIIKDDIISKEGNIISIEEKQYNFFGRIAIHNIITAEIPSKVVNKFSKSVLSKTCSENLSELMKKYYVKAKKILHGFNQMKTSFMFFEYYLFVLIIFFILRLIVTKFIVFRLKSKIISFESRFFINRKMRYFVRFLQSSIFWTAFVELYFDIFFIICLLITFFLLNILYVCFIFLTFF